MACGPRLTPHITEAYWKKIKAEAEKNSTSSYWSTPAISVSQSSGPLTISNTSFNYGSATNSYAIYCQGNMSVHGNLHVNGSLSVTGNITYSNSLGYLDDSTTDLINRIKDTSVDKLKDLDLVFKKNLKRFRAIDKAYNIARENDIYDNLRIELEAIWSFVKENIDQKAYNVRDALWDAVVASAVKDSITEDEFNILYRPYFLMSISEPSSS